MKNKKFLKRVVSIGLLCMSAVMSACSGSGDVNTGIESISDENDENTEAALATENTGDDAEAVTSSDKMGETDSVYGKGDMENTFFENNQIEENYNSPDWVAELAASLDENASQLFVVGGMGMDLTTATVSMHEKDQAGNWKQLLITPGFIGKNGLCEDLEHKEGCGQTPI